jgi:hypothetical protein
MRKRVANEICESGAKDTRSPDASRLPGNPKGGCYEIQNWKLQKLGDF